MTRIAYVDHSYHRTTGSTAFLPAALAERGHRVDTFWDEAWIGGAPVPWEQVAEHDVVIMFQSYCAIGDGSFRSRHPNVVYIPMFDQFGFSQHHAYNLATFWEPFQGSKILSFSTSVHALATGFGIVSHLVRYYPEVPPKPLRKSEGLHGFIWLRRESELNWNIVRALVGSTRFNSFHVHCAGDPGFPPVQPPPAADLEALNVTTSTWFERRADLDEIVRRANVYFAPRLAEGIGQAFLEAICRGQCVVAADAPTMNEYIVHGVNGLLYDPGSPEPLDFSDVARLGHEARRGAIAGRRRWENSEERLAEFVLAPSSTLYRESAQAPTPAVASGSRMTKAVRSISRAVKTAVARRGT